MTAAMAFVNCSPIHRPRFSPLLANSASLPSAVFAAPRIRACAAPEQTANASSEHDTQDETQSFLLPPSTIATIVRGTMLQGCELASVYSSDVAGFSNESFFDTQMALGGVPSLVLGRTEKGVFFGGYTAYGFLGRDDYREATSENAMFVFSLRGDNVMMALPTDLVFYDFYDYAVRFGAALLCIPMNPSKHIMRANAASSSCWMPDGTTSVFGEFSMANLESLQVLVAKKYVDEMQQEESKPTGLFSRLFG